jgi:hypothetical protein
MKNTKPYRLRALPCVEVGATVICEQVPNGRNTNSNCTACQPILWKKLSLQLRKNRTACLGKTIRAEGNDAE